MAFTADQKSVIYEILGIPENGYSVNTLSLVHAPYSNVGVWNPSYNTGDFTAMLASIAAQIARVEAIASCQTRVSALLTRWDEIGTSSMTAVSKSPSGAEGKIFDAEVERCNIRLRLSNLVGVSVPKGGFLAEIEATYGKSAGKMVNSSAGDR
jgi:hypothetical protein